jgi:Phage integrase, N-terminal SAM-like domain
MTDKPISPLRQRMIEDMTARHFAEKAQTDYIRYVNNFAAFLGRSPDTASAEDLRLFQQHMTKTHVSPGIINATVVALRFFFKVTLERNDLVRRLTLVTEPRRAPIVLSPEVQPSTFRITICPEDSNAQKSTPTSADATTSDHASGARAAAANDSVSAAR